MIVSVDAGSLVQIVDATGETGDPGTQPGVVFIHIDKGHVFGKTTGLGIHRPLFKGIGR